MHFPWSFEEADERGFNIKSYDNDTHLVIPKRDKEKWNIDESNHYSETSEISWRSSLLDGGMNEISGGFPKFFDYGLCPYVDNYIVDSVRSGDSISTIKLDGSLIIRSVIDNKVHFRTRGSNELGIYEKPVMDIIEKKYKSLLDPSVCPGAFLFFEYISPQNQIVIHYDEPDLILIGEKCTYKNCFVLLSYESMERTAIKYNLSIVDALCLPYRNTNEIIDGINKLQDEGKWDEEGIVIRDNYSNLMCRIKTDQYKRMFHLISTFSIDDIHAICKNTYIKCPDDVVQYLKENNAPKYFLDAAKDLSYEYYNRLDIANHIIDVCKSYIKQFKEKNSGIDAKELKKQFALSLNEKHPDKDLYFALYDNKYKHVERWVTNRLLAPVDITVRGFFSLRDNENVL